MNFNSFPRTEAPLSCGEVRGGALGTAVSVQNYTYNTENQRTDLSYDANGNLTSLNGFAFTWNGRKLATATSANSNISYTYNHNGIRTSKTVNGTTKLFFTGFSKKIKQ